MPSLDERLCAECAAPLKGRMDKKFCSDPCRVAFNNRVRSDDIHYVRNINNRLRRNRRILMDLNPTGKNKVSIDILRAKGFDFTHFTSMYRTGEGAQYFYCYDQGYLPIEKNYYLLVVKKEYTRS